MLLSAWLDRHPLTNKELAGKIDRSEEAARLYRAGLRRPDRDTTARIEQLTQGRVRAADLQAAWAAAHKARTTSCG